MTEDKIALKALLEQASDADFLRDIIGFAAERMMALEVEALTGADYRARNPERSNYGRRVAERSAAEGSLLDTGVGFVGSDHRRATSPTEDRRRGVNA